MKKHIYIFDGPAMTGKSLLANMIKDKEAVVLDGNTLDFENTKDIALYIKDYPPFVPFRDQINDIPKNFIVISNNFHEKCLHNGKEFDVSRCLIDRLKVLMPDCLITVCDFSKGE